MLSMSPIFLVVRREDLGALGVRWQGFELRHNPAGSVSRPRLVAVNDDVVGAFRVRIREVELVNTRVTPGVNPAPPQRGSSGELKERTMFTDVVPLKLSPR